MINKTKYVLIICTGLILLIVCYLMINNNHNIKESDLEGYTLVDLKEETLKKYESVNNEYETIFFEIKDNDKLKLLNTEDEYLEFKNGKLIYINGNNYCDKLTIENINFDKNTDSVLESINDKNISKVYYLYNNPYHNIYVIDSEGKLYINGFSEDLSQNPSSDSGCEIMFEEANISFKAISIDDIVITGNDYDIKEVDVIISSDDGNLYSLVENRIYDYVYVMHDYELVEDKHGTILRNKNTAYIKENREVEINNTIIDYKFRNSFVYVSMHSPQEPAFFVTTDNHLYSIKKNDLVNPNKIKSIYYKYNDEYYGGYIVVFEDNKYVKFDGNNEQIDTEYILN